MVHNTKINWLIDRQFHPSRWKQNVTPKHWYPATRLHDFTEQKTTILHRSDSWCSTEAVKLLSSWKNINLLWNLHNGPVAYSFACYLFCERTVPPSFLFSSTVTEICAFCLGRNNSERNSTFSEARAQSLLLLNLPRFIFRKTRKAVSISQPEKLHWKHFIV